MRQPVLLFFVAIVAVISLAAIFHGPINRQMHAWKLLPETERLTELYFTNPNSLPKTYTPDGQQTVSFTVHNIEYRTMQYSYQIIGTGSENTQPQILASGTFTLKQNEYHKPVVNISTPDMGPDAKVEVKLVNVNESIHYLVRRV